MQTIQQELNWRGLINQVTDQQLFKTLADRSVTLYCGFDPTADSLHVGSLLPLITMKRLQRYGHQLIVLLGGGTGLIGDPSGKSDERPLLSRADIVNNIASLSKLITGILDDPNNQPIIADNYQWLSQQSYIDFLRDIGKHFAVNAMIAKESVKQRLTTREQGISYTEFSYALLQAYDFVELNRRYRCTLQIGGSDQWGNITSGIELIRKLVNRQQLTKQEVYGLTVPLLVRSDGGKFGKTEKGNVWLDSKRTSVYDFYQFFLQVADRDALTLAKYLTFISQDDYRELENITERQPQERQAQKFLARQLTSMIHGDQQLATVETTSKAIFENEQPLTKCDAETIVARFGNLPKLIIARTRLPHLKLIEVLVECGLCSSKGQARRDIEGGGIYLNDQRVTDIQLIIDDKQLLAANYLLVGKGKRQRRLLSFE